MLPIRPNQGAQRRRVRNCYRLYFDISISVTKYVYFFYRICQCGYIASDHGKCRGDSKTDTKWDPIRHTKTEKTDAFGEIEFVGYSQRSLANVQYF